MTDYSAPLKDMTFVINEIADLNGVTNLPGLEEATPDLVEAILEEAAKFCSGVLSPLNPIGDRQMSKLVDGKVQTPDGWQDAFKAYTEGGWNGLAFDPDHGGQGLPWLVAAAFNEMVQASNMSFGLCPLLNQGAIEALVKHADDDLKATYLEKLVTGEWCGTMNLTEAQAGSDLAAIRTKAMPQDGHYLIKGQKIFITYGDHDLSDNIIHLVLARTPEAPAGVKGISLFVVPKVLVNPDGTLGEANDVQCLSLEEKLGIHASPTAVMAFGEKDGAIGYLVGEENQGLKYMFTMMNLARLSVGIQGLAISERAYQQARTYALERVQGRPIGSNDDKAPIINHPDVRRMLMTMKAATEAMRCLAYTAMAAMDGADRHYDKGEKAWHQKRVDLLTPVVKGWSTELANEITSLGIQIHGGTGYIEETGAAQFYRDARITAIYEGTTAIQANALINRNLLNDDGKAIRGLIREINLTAEEMAVAPSKAFRVMSRGLKNSLEHLEECTRWMLNAQDQDPRLPAAASVPYLMMLGTLLGGWQLAQSAIKADAFLKANIGDARFMKGKIVTAEFYIEHLMTRVGGYAKTIREGSETVFRLNDNQF